VIENNRVRAICRATQAPLVNAIAARSSAVGPFEAWLTRLRSLRLDALAVAEGALPLRLAVGGLATVFVRGRYARAVEERTEPEDTAAGALRAIGLPRGVALAVAGLAAPVDVAQLLTARVSGAVRDPERGSDDGRRGWDRGGSVVVLAAARATAYEQREKDQQEATSHGCGP